MKRAFAYIIALSLPATLLAQVPVREDTVFIKEVIISRKNAIISAPGFRKIKIDSVVTRIYNHSSVASLIAENSTLYIKNYGAGGLATPSFRGTSPGHTIIAWNDINLNSPMLGQYDLSLIPAGLIDEVDIRFGGASMDQASGGIGGKINLSTKPDWTNRNSLMFSPAAGSFGKYSGLISFKSGSENFQSSTKVFFQSAENDFPYLNTFETGVPVKEFRKDNQMQQKGILQELYYKRKKSIMSAALWYQATSRNLPAPIIAASLPSGEKQYDESIRTLFKYDATGENINYRFAASFSADKLHYTNRQASVDSRNNGRTITLRSGAETRINSSAKIKLDLYEELNIINTSNYEENKLRNLTSVTASAEGSLLRNLTATLLLREILLDRTLLSPDFSAGLQFKIFAGKEYYLKGNFSGNSKVPTLNDMYWVPGGNPDLKNESGLTSELSVEISDNLFDKLHILTDVTFFRNDIRNMIQWHPGRYAYWTPDNIGAIKTTGIEAGLDLKSRLWGMDIVLSSDYSHTRAINNSFSEEENSTSKNRLIYVPSNLFNSGLRINWNRLYSSFNTNYTGLRFIDADNTRYLPAFTVCNTDLGARLRAKQLLFDMNIRIENLFNIDYQNIAWYPMPGRSFLVSLKILIEK